MEFSIFIQGYMPGPDAHNPVKEHEFLMKEMELVKAADKHNWKYVWLSEHHALPEYSHLSANEAVAGYLAASTERIHIGSGIFNLSPRVNHPVRTAEKVAMLDHLSNRRFEFGTGRGAGSHEVATFNIHDPTSTKSEYYEVLPEIVRMWEQKDYTFQGKHFQLDTPHDILPKPNGQGHPPIWRAVGSPGTWKEAGELGIGALGFTFSSIKDMGPLLDSYKQAVADCPDPVGQFKNDNAMITSGVRCSLDRDKARKQASNPSYIITLVTLYHDTFPRNPLAARWPNPPVGLPAEGLDEMLQLGYGLVGTPEEICEQLQPYVKAGIDQLGFGVPNDVSHEEALEMIETFGKYVIPEFDKDPVHLTDKYRASAKPKYQMWDKEPPPITTMWSERARG
ncbi:MAG TPA: LLM class flavin-dependent oxidoreductase [Acidimicrobiales bacterium]|nr:LLM class flavin-dependent oxidoreductase [Acidimicrobiales bacterium]